MSDVKNIAQMGVNEVFEDLIYNVAYGEIYSKLNKVIPLDDGYLKDALQSGLSVVFSSALMVYMNKQDTFIKYIFGIISTSVIASLNGFGGFVKNKLSRMVGRKLKIASGSGFSSMDERIQKAKLYVEYGNLAHQSLLASSSYSNSKNGYLSSSSSVISQNSQKLDYAKAKLDATHKSLFLKLFTKRFTSA
ncbi:hypothetical protein, partial [Campylobacter fetus]|uniref:hypothetical protein n=1 Tax=Campylobacter fetus TaxID=196 RepID=UPI0008188CAC